MEQALARRRALVAILALALASVAAPLRADDLALSDSPDTADGWKKLLEYTSCALATFKASTPTDWLAAVALCGHMYLDESANTPGSLR